MYVSWLAVYVELHAGVVQVYAYANLGIEDIHMYPYVYEHSYLMSNVVSF